MRNLLVLLLIFLFYFNSKSQTWCPPGAMWYYRVYFTNPPYHDGVIELSYTNTVSVNSVICKELVGDFYGKMNAASSPSTIINNWVNIKTVESNSVYMVYDSYHNKFDTIANFNAVPGDKWLLAMLPAISSSTCSYPRPTVNVLSTSTVIINSQVLKRIIVNYAPYPSGNITDTIVEKIGGVRGFLFPLYHCIVDGPMYGTLSCYSDPNFGLYKKSGIINCNYDPTAVKPIDAPGLISMHPNPAQNLLKIEFENSAFSELRIKDIAGKQLKSVDLRSKSFCEVEISELTSAVYFIEFLNNDKVITTKKLIRE